MPRMQKGRPGRGAPNQLRTNNSSTPKRHEPDTLPIGAGPLTREEYRLVARAIARPIRQGCNRARPWPTESVVAAAVGALANGLWRVHGRRERERRGPIGLVGVDG